MNFDDFARNLCGAFDVSFKMISNQTFHLQSLPTAAIIALSIPAILIILLTVFGNLLVLFFKARVGRTNTTLLVWNLGLTDFLVGLFVLPIGAVYLIHRKWIFGRLMCRIWVGADVTFCTCSVVTICVISADRYLAVTRPLRYKSVITKFKIVIVIICIWAFSLGILLSTVRWDSNFEWDRGETMTCFAGHEIRYLAHSVVFAFFLPASVTLTLYWRIYRLARNRQRALDRGFLMILGRNMNFLTNTLSQTVLPTALRVHVGKNNGMVEHQRRVLRTHERVAKTLGVVSCSFLFCWLPFFTLYLLNYKCESCLPSLIIDIASWLGYCNSMINPIIYSFTVKEFKRSTFSAIHPFWAHIYRLFPKYICKPPDPKASQRIARRKQHYMSRLRTKNKNVNALMPNYDYVKRKVPPKNKGAIASLMVNTNCSIAQNLLTSAAITPGEGDERKITEKMVKIERTTTIGVKSNVNGGNNWIEANTNKRHHRLNECRLKGRRNEENNVVNNDEVMGNEKIEEDTNLLNQNGLVTATLLLATLRESKKKKMNEANSLPPTLSPGGTGSDESSPRRVYRMPCKISMKKLKRHSLPDTSAAGRICGRGEGKTMVMKGRILPQFKKKEARGNERKNSPSSGLWQRATARAIALRDQFMMSKSNSFGSLSSRKRERIAVGEGIIKEEEKEENEKKEEKKDDAILEAEMMKRSSVDLIKEKVGWMFKSFEEDHQPQLENGGKLNEEKGEEKEEEETANNLDVHIVCLTDAIDL